MKLTIYKVDAFAEKAFEGNPAAVVPLQEWLPDSLMQQIAMENNLSETAFFVPVESGFHIRWFTPKAEVKLCGHATLASAHVLFSHIGFTGNEISFDSLSGVLKVTREKELIILDFPALTATETETPAAVASAFHIVPKACLKGRDDYMLLFENEQEVLSLQPDFQKLINAQTRGVICTSKSENYDFVSRFFAPAVGVNEDPVTGSAHTMLIPFWAEKLGKPELLAKQVSARGGILHCKSAGDRVKIGENAVTFLTGEITV